MKISYLLPVFLLGISFTAGAQSENSDIPNEIPRVITDPGKYNPLSREEAQVILQKGTEYPFSSPYHNLKKKGTYICRQCNQPLFSSKDKFDSGTGWPSFDDIIFNNVEELPDADGQRTEIVCLNCQGHLGHVFRGEGFTRKRTRHCVNSVSLRFVPAEKVDK